MLDRRFSEVIFVISTPLSLFCVFLLLHKTCFIWMSIYCGWFKCTGLGSLVFESHLMSYTNVLKHVSLYAYNTFCFAWFCFVLFCFLLHFLCINCRCLIYFYHVDLRYITSERLLCEEESQWKALGLVL